MNILKFKLKYQGKGYKCKEYDMIANNQIVGYLAINIVGKDIHIFNVDIEEEWRGHLGFKDWLQSFRTIYVYGALPEAIDYWIRRKATIVSTVKQQRFYDIIFEQEDFNDNFGRFYS